jgi:hypothetical protein
VQLLAAVRSSLEACAHEAAWLAPAHKRLAFRELGLAIGLLGLARTPDAAGASPAVGRSLAALRSYLPMGDRIIEFWAEAHQRQSTAWTSHQHINDVMLATALLPDGYFGRPGIP